MIERQTLTQAELLQMEEMTMKLSAMTATLVVLFAAVSMVSQAQAGASASAPSKNTRSSQLASQQNHQNEFGITEYSSSSARNRSH